MNSGPLAKQAIKAQILVLTDDFKLKQLFASYFLLTYKIGLSIFDCLYSSVAFNLTQHF